jgi:hypothetical protein
MPKVAVGLFKHPSSAKLALEEVAASGFPQSGLRLIGEPRVMEDVTVGSLENIRTQPGAAATSTARADFESQLSRELIGFSATEREVEVYVREVRLGAVLVFASGSDLQVDSAAAILNRHGASDVEELRTERPLTATAPHPPATPTESISPIRDESVQTGRSRSGGGGARVFVW